MPALLLAITNRPEDLSFARNLASSQGLVFKQALTVEAIQQFILENPNTLVLWDVDHPHADNPRDPMYAGAVGVELKRSIRPDRVIAISDKPLSETPYLSTVPAFNHHLFRRYAEPSPKIYARVAMASMIPDPFGVAQYLPEGTSVRKITLKRSTQRKAAVEAVESVFLKLGGHPRLATMLAQSCDELLMNAIFSAPVDDSGAHHRAKLKRDSDFELGEREQVTVEMGATDDLLALSVADSFGSIDKNRVLSFIQKDYQKRAFATEAATGLGLYGIFSSGQSLLFAWKPGKRTEVILVFPIARNLKAFKETFRFFSFVEK